MPNAPIPIPASRHIPCTVHASRVAVGYLPLASGRYRAACVHCVEVYRQAEGLAVRRRAPNERRRRFTKAEREAVRLAWGNRCSRCGQLVQLGQGTVDHIVPLAHGGKHLFSNWGWCHRSCNTRKGAVMPTRAECWR